MLLSLWWFVGRGGWGVLEMSYFYLGGGVVGMYGLAVGDEEC